MGSETNNVYVLLHFRELTALVIEMKHYKK